MCGASEPFPYSNFHKVCSVLLHLPYMDPEALYKCKYILKDVEDVVRWVSFLF